MSPDPELVLARRTLLDVLEALEPHLASLVMVGAQAVYLHAGERDGLAVAPSTTDADLVIDPATLATEPLLAERLQEAGFTPSRSLGGWCSPRGVFVDLIVPEAVGGPGRRGARLGPHGKRVARKCTGPAP